MWIVFTMYDDVKKDRLKLKEQLDQVVQKGNELHMFLKTQQSKIMNQISPNKEKLAKLNREITEINNRAKVLKFKTKVIKFPDNKERN
jgi:predicted nuclease with TOPRIM domain